MKRLLTVLVLLPMTSLAIEFSAGLGTEFPVGWSLEAKASFPDSSLYSSFRYGKFISSYINSLNDISESQGFYNSATGQIIEETLKNATHYDFAIGYQQSPRSGWLTELAYTSISGDGQVTGSVIAAAVADINLPSGSHLYDVKQTLETY